MIQKKIRIGVLGCASIAKRLVIPAIKELSSEFELIAIASRSYQKAIEFSDHFDAVPIEGYDKLVKRVDIDAIYIPLPTGMHYEWILKALHAGKHVLSEKSITTNYSDTKHIIEVARKNKLLVMENFMFKYHNQHKIVFKNLKSNSLGSIRLFRSQFGFPPMQEGNFRYNNVLGGGSLLDAGAYTIMASRFFLGSNQEVISAVLYNDKKNKIDIFGNASIKNEKGIISQLSFGFDNFYQCNLEFWGSKGRLSLPKAFTPKTDEITKVLIETSNKFDLVEVKPDNHFVKILKTFSELLFNGDYEPVFDDILDQSRTLNDIREKAIIINI